MLVSQMGLARCELANYLAGILANYLAKIGELFGNFQFRAQGFATAHSGITSPKF